MIREFLGVNYQIILNSLKNEGVTQISHKTDKNLQPTSIKILLYFRSFPHLYKFKQTLNGLSGEYWEISNENESHLELDKSLAQNVFNHFKVGAEGKNMLNNLLRIENIHAEINDGKINADDELEKFCCSCLIM